MSSQTTRFRLLVSSAASSALLLAGCGGGDQGSANSLETLKSEAAIETIVFAGTEDTPLQDTLNPNGEAGPGASFAVVRLPEHGTVSIDRRTGSFAYVPAANHNGTDTFTFRTFVPGRRLPAKAVEITLAAVNDAPTFAAIPDMTNSAETRDTSLVLPVEDVDGDELQVSVTSEDETVAEVAANDVNRSITIAPGARGSTRVHVTVRDGEFALDRDFEFTVGDVTKRRTLAASAADGDAITFTNTTDQPIAITFEHNGFPLFQSDDEIVQYVRDMPSQYGGEPFERKLWRFVRDNTYHRVPLTPEQWLHDSWALLAQGWGICSHVSAAYVILARKAGYEARVWGLTGHVVPEIKINGRWEIFDPDLSVYYFNVDSQIANVEDIESNPSLILSPINRILPANHTHEYSSLVADIYSSAADNFIGDGIFIANLPGRFQPLVLPPGSRFTYPGKWTSSVIGVDGVVPFDVPYYLQSELLTPADWTGTVTLPHMIWEIHGSGRVRVLGEEFDVDSPALQAKLQNPGRQITEIEVLSAGSELQFISFINAMRYDLASSNAVSLTAKDIWGVEVGLRTLAPNVRPLASGTTEFRKPAY
jgi:hypothetical protein